MLRLFYRRFKSAIVISSILFWCAFPCSAQAASWLSPTHSTWASGDRFTASQTRSSGDVITFSTLLAEAAVEVPEVDSAEKEAKLKAKQEKEFAKAEAKKAKELAKAEAKKIKEAKEAEEDSAKAEAKKAKKLAKAEAKKAKEMSKSKEKAEEAEASKVEKSPVAT